MKKPEERYFTIGELAGKAGVTVRTLQYYDKINLLKATMSKEGRRLYTQSDIERLQQILFFKSLGFSLEEIAEKIMKPKESEDLEKVFVGQREILRGQIEKLNLMVQMLDAVIDEAKDGKKISLDKLMTIMELMKQNNPYTFIVHYLSNDQIKSTAEKFEVPGNYEQYMNGIHEMFSRLDTLYRSGADPAGEEGQQLAEDWWRMVNEFAGGDPEMLKTMVSAGMDIGNWPETVKPLQEAIEHFLTNALQLYFQRQGINLTEMEKNAND